MKDLGKLTVCIPARAGSKRVKAKNLRSLCGKPLISYAISISKTCFESNNIYVNSDSTDILALAAKEGVNTYHRSAELASDSATGDQFAYDFMKKILPDTLVMISPVCPLITKNEVQRALHAYTESEADTLITCESTQMQTFCKDEPVNIDLSGQLAPTQNNSVVSILNWAITIWDVDKFVSNYEKNGSAYIAEPFFS